MVLLTRRSMSQYKTVLVGYMVKSGSGTGFSSSTSVFTYKYHPTNPLYLFISLLVTLYISNRLSSSLISKNLKIKIYRTIISPVVLYGYETWSLTLMEEHRLRVIENSILRRKLGTKREGVTGEWRKLHKKSIIISVPHHTLFGERD